MTEALWILQILILSVGIYVFLRFLQTTRGSRLLRGLLVSFLVVAVGLSGLTRALELEVLGHILQSVAGFFVILLAVLFQPELRRGIAQLGEGSFLGRFIRRLSRDTIQEVVQAVQSMAARRTGALIALECESSLDPYIEGGVKLDANVHRLLLESLFHPGATLHDGAVVIRKDRIAAAACLFPLTENIQIARSTGTRHRAALGLSDETDAVTIVVSEETGRISVARGGQMRAVPANRLEAVLREVLGDEERSEEPSPGPGSLLRRAPAAVLGYLRSDWMWLATAVLLACGIYYSTQRDLQDTKTFSVRLVPQVVGHQRPAARGEVAVLLPSEEFRIVDQNQGGLLKVQAVGTRAQLQDLPTAPSGILEIPEPAAGRMEVELGAIRWDHEDFGVRYSWAGEAPTLDLRRFERRTFELTPDAIAIDDSRRDPHFGVHLDGLTFQPAVATIEGPEDVLGRLGDELPLQLEAVELPEGQKNDFRASVDLLPELRDENLALVGGPVTVTVPLRPAVRQLGPLTREVALVCTDPARSGELGRWALPSHAQTARFSIRVSGLIPAGAESSSPVVVERSEAILRFIEENLTVYVDLAELPAEGQGRSLPVRWTLREDWRSGLDFLRLESGPLGERESLEVRLESEPTVLVEERKAGAARSPGSDSQGL